MPDTQGLSRSDFQSLARMRLREARVLLHEGHCSGAYYLAGYGVECALKACIARRTERHSFPDRNRTRDSHTHDLALLLTTAGLREPLEDAARSNPALSKSWTVVRDWNTASRYDATIGLDKARELYTALTGRNGVVPWLKRHW